MEQGTITTTGMLDSTFNSQIVASGGTINFPNFSGLIVINNE